MKQIKKKISDSKYGSVASRLASYSAVAACVLTSGGDIMAQCGTATVGAPLPVDIDGDGTPDINLIASNFSTPILLASGMISSTVPSFTVPTSFSFTATVVPPGPGTSWNGCITTQLPGGTFTGIDPSATAMGPISVTGNVNFYNVNINSVYAYFYTVSAGFATAGGNQIVGLSAGGSDVCSAIAGAAATVNLGTCFNVSSSYLQYVTAGGYSSMLVPMGSVTLDHPPCTTTGSNYYAGLVQTLSFLPGTFTNPGTVLLSGPNYYGPNYVSQQCNPGSTFLGVEFAGGDGTQYGWVEVVYNPDGSITCVNSGYNGCSVEEVAAAGGAAGVDECIAVGAATVNTGNEACTVVVACTLDALGLAAGACVDPGTPTTGDDTFDLTIDPTGTGLAAGDAYTITGGVTGAGVIGTPSTIVGLPADGNPISVTVTATDANGETCMLTEMVTAPMACSTPETPIAVADPCDCDNGVDEIPEDNPNDGFEYAAETITFSMGVAPYTATAVTGLFDNMGNALTVADINAQLAAGNVINAFVLADGTAPSYTLDFMDSVGTTGSSMGAACEPCPMLMCSVAATQQGSPACDDGGTPEDGSDDLITFTVAVTGMNTGNSTTFSDDQGNVGITYGTALTYTLAPNSNLTVVFTDDDTVNNAGCTTSIDLVSTDCVTVENIPTVGEWGLIMLGLLMSITAIVGIRQRREEEVTA